MRLGLLVRRLPAGTTLYAQEGTDVVQVSGDAVLRNLDAGDASDAARTYWAPDFGGAGTTLEVELPASVNLAELDIALPKLSHFLVSPDAPNAAPVVKAATRCNVDISCHADYSRESRSVARMAFIDDGSSHVCTGTLLNDATSTHTPWFLRANHCISTQTVASTLVTTWFYRSSACNSRTENPAKQRLTGATHAPCQRQHGHVLHAAAGPRAARQHFCGILLWHHEQGHGRRQHPPP